MMNYLGTQWLNSSLDHLVDQAFVATMETFRYAPHSETTVKVHLFILSNKLDHLSLATSASLEPSKNPFQLQESLKKVREGWSDKIQKVELSFGEEVFVIIQTLPTKIEQREDIPLLPSQYLLAYSMSPALGYSFPVQGENLEVGSQSIDLAETAKQIIRRKLVKLPLKEELQTEIVQTLFPSWRRTTPSIKLAERRVFLNFRQN